MRSSSVGRGLSFANSHSLVAALVVSVAAVAALLWMTRGLLGHAPLYDELLHVLAARGLNATGTPAIADGFYTRASLFTTLVAAALRTFGDSLSVARLPSLAAAALLLVLVACWTTRRAGVVAGGTAAAVLCLLPQTLQLAVFVRFYTLHALVILTLAILAWEASRPDIPPRRRVFCTVAALALLPLGWHLQPSTAIAAVAVLAGVLVVCAMDHWTTLAPVLARHRLAFIAAILALAAAGLYAASALGLLAMLREVPVWAAWAADSRLYYVQRLAAELPLLWPLFPLALVLSLRRSPRLAAFCAVVFLTGLLVHSIAASKQVRYVYYLLPFGAVLAGLAVQSLFDVDRRPSRGLLAGALIVVALSFSIEGQRTARLLAGRLPPVVALPYLVEADWTGVADELRKAAAGADRVVTSNAMKALYHLRRHDLELNASIVPETQGGVEFGRDPRTGRPAISTAASLRQVLEMGGTTFVVLEVESLNRATHVPVEAVQLLDQRCEALVVGAGAGLRTWRCGEKRSVVR